MKKLIKVSMTCLLALVVNFTYAQDVIKLKTTEYSYRTYDTENKTWTKWSSWEDVSNLVVFNFGTERVTIYAKETLIYDMIGYNNYEDKDGDDVHKFTCVDDDGTECKLRLLILKNQNQKTQIYVDYDRLQIAYNVNPLD